MFEPYITHITTIYERTRRSWWPVFALGAISMAFRALQEIAKWRVGMSYLPDWVFSTNGIFNLDGYHIVTTIHWMVAVAVGQEIALRSGRRLRWWGWLLVWFTGGQFMDMFYHTIWMRHPELWLHDYIEGFKYLLGVIF